MIGFFSSFFSRKINSTELFFYLLFAIAIANTVEPLFSGQLLKSRNYCQYNTVNKTPFKRPRPRPRFRRPDERSSIVFAPI